MQNEWQPMMPMPVGAPQGMPMPPRTKPRGGASAALLALTAPMLIIIATFVLGGIAPFGMNTMLCDGNSAWFSDFAQWRAVLGGEADIMYSFSRGLGGDFFSVWSGGLCSPFLLPSVLFSADALPQALAVATLLRAGAAGLFTYLAMRSLAGRMPYAAMSFAVAYASGSLLCLGFLAPQHADAAVWLPLAAAGVSTLVRTGRAPLYFFGSTLFLLCCGQLWPILVIFSIGYFAWCQLVLGSRRNLWARLGLFVAALGSSVGAAMVALIPAFSVNSEISQAVYPVSRIDSSGFFDVLAAMFSGAFSANVIVPLLFCSVLTVLMLPLYFFNSRLPLGERQVCALFIVFLIVSMAVPALCWMWLGFSVPTGMISSCGCVFCLFAVSAAVRMTAQPSRVRVGKVLLSWLIVAGMFLCALIFGRVEYSAAGIIFTAAFLTMYAAITIVALSGNGIGVGFCLVVLICVGCECAVGGMLGLETAARELPLVGVAEQQAESDRMLDLKSVIGGSELGGASPFYRIRGAQAAFAACADAPWKTTGECEKLLEVLGIHAGEGYTPVTDSLFGVKYIVSQESQADYALIGVAGGLNVARCDTALSLCAASGSQAGSLTSFSSNPFTAQNEMVSAIAGTARELFINASLSTREGIGASVTETMNGVEFIRTEQTGYARFSVLIPADGTLYMFLDDDSHRVESVAVDGRDYGPQTLGTINGLGRYARGAQVSVTVSITGERLELGGTWFAVLDRTLCEASMQSLGQRAAANMTVDGGTVRCSVTVSEGQMIMTSIPWQSGWRAYLDGERVETVRVCGALLGVNAAAGVHSLRLEYEPPEFQIALIFSAAFLLFGTLLFFILDANKLSGMYRRSRSLPEPEPEPEADIFEMYEEYMIPDAESLDEHEEDFDDYFRGM